MVVIISVFTIIGEFCPPSAASVVIGYVLLFCNLDIDVVVLQFYCFPRNYQRQVDMM